MTVDDTNDVLSCTDCKKEENDPNKLMTCLYCFSSVHFKCRNISGSSIRKLKQNMYFCTAKCSDIYKRITDMQNKRSLIVDSLGSELKKSIHAIVSAQMSEIKNEVSSITKAIEDSQQFLSSKFDDIVHDFEAFKAENCRLRSEVDVLKNELSALKTFTHNLECSVDKANKESIGNNAMIHGVPVQSNEEVTEIVAKVADCIGAELPTESLISVSRVSPVKSTIGKLVPIRIVFRSKAVKESFLAKKRKYGMLSSAVIDQSMVLNGKPSNIAIRDELTSYSLKLLHEIRSFQKDMNLKYVWAGRDGAVLVKKDETSKPIIIKNRNDINKLVQGSSTSQSLTNFKRAV